MQNYKDMMQLTVEKRREFFRKAYIIEMGRAHATLGYKWPIERLPAMVDKAMSEIADRRMPNGGAIDAVKKFFVCKKDEDVFTFLEY